MPKLPEQHRPLSAKLTKHEEAPVGTKRLKGRPAQRRNARLFRRNPLCVECFKLGVVKEAEEWDHVKQLSEGGAEHESNLQGLCRLHHKEKSARENKARAAKDRYRGSI